MAYGKVTENTVYTCTGHPLRSDIANILDWALNKDFTTAYRRIPHCRVHLHKNVMDSKLVKKKNVFSFFFLFLLNASSIEILELKTLKGLALHDILTEVHLLIHRGKFT